MSLSGFCKRCYDKALAIIKAKGLEGRAVVDPSKMTFWCKIPRFTHDNTGRVMVVMLDCEKRQENKMTLEEYKRRRAVGEL